MMEFRNWLVEQPNACPPTAEGSRAARRTILESRAKHSGFHVYPIIKILYQAVYLPYKVLASKLCQGKKAQNEKSVHGSLSLGNTGDRARP